MPKEDGPYRSAEELPSFEDQTRERLDKLEKWREHFADKQIGEQRDRSMSNSKSINDLEKKWRGLAAPNGKSPVARATFLLVAAVIMVTFMVATQVQLIYMFNLIDWGDPVGVQYLIYILCGIASGIFFTIVWFKLHEMLDRN